MITVIIASKNRPDALMACLKSIVKNDQQKFEIIVSKQDNLPLLYTPLSSQNRIFTCLFTPKWGKSYALNSAITKAQGDVIAFTDDDCIIPPTWISEINSVFSRYPDISCITGNTYPYKNLPHWKCQPTFSKKLKIYSKPIHHSQIGFGNNFAIKKSVLESIGFFKIWLGPGSVGLAAEDGEMINRLLITKHNILHDPKMTVYHNKLLTNEQVRIQKLSYTCGEMACYGYYAFSGWKFAKIIINKNFNDSFMDIKRIAGDIVKRKIIRANDWIDSVNTFLTRVKGLCIGCFYYAIACIPTNTLHN
jgi:O-antigen biosynthesis protein